jgi:hypothetical protein
MPTDDHSEAGQLVGDRKERYGSVIQTSTRYTTIRSLLDDLPEDTSNTERYCLEMLAVKFARLIGNPKDEDTLKDIQGYCHLMLYGDS